MQRTSVESIKKILIYICNVVLVHFLFLSDDFHSFGSKKITRSHTHTNTHVWKFFVCMFATSKRTTATAAGNKKVVSHWFYNCRANKVECNAIAKTAAATLPQE